MVPALLSRKLSVSSAFRIPTLRSTYFSEVRFQQFHTVTGGHRHASSFLANPHRPLVPSSDRAVIAEPCAQYGRRSFSWKVPDPQAYSNKLLPQWPLRTFNRLPNFVVIAGLIATNITVWYLWDTLLEEYKEELLERFRIMNLLFIDKGSTLLGERPWTIITSSFSHLSNHTLIQDVSAILLVSFPVAKVVGNSMFIAIYLMGGAASRVARYTQSLINPEYRGLTEVDRAFLDSRGAAAALMSTYACMFRFLRRHIDPNTFIMYPTAHAFAPMLIWAAWCFSCLCTDFGDNIGVDVRASEAGWLGGTVSGVLVYFLRIRPHLYRGLPRF